MQAADQAGASAITRETLDNSLSILHSANDAFNGEVAALEDELKTVRSENASLKTSNEALQTSTTAINEDVGVLFDERDMLVSTVAAATTRIENLETLVRALTGQSISSAGSMGSPSPQTLPVKTSNGAKLDLAVPKGKPLVE